MAKDNFEKNIRIILQESKINLQKGIADHNQEKKARIAAKN